MEKWYDIIGSSIEMRLRDSVDPEKSRWIRGAGCCRISLSRWDYHHEIG